MKTRTPTSTPAKAGLRQSGETPAPWDRLTSIRPGKNGHHAMVSAGKRKVHCTRVVEGEAERGSAEHHHSAGHDRTSPTTPSAPTGAAGARAQQFEAWSEAAAGTCGVRARIGERMPRRAARPVQPGRRSSSSHRLSCRRRSSSHAEWFERSRPRSHEVSRGLPRPPGRVSHPDRIDRAERHAATHLPFTWDS